MPYVPSAPPIPVPSRHGTESRSPATIALPWGCSSIGRAFDWQSKGRGFESPQLHQTGQNREPSLWRFNFSSRWATSGRGSVLRDARAAGGERPRRHPQHAGRVSILATVRLGSAPPVRLLRQLAVFGEASELTVPVTPRCRGVAKGAVNGLGVTPFECPWFTFRQLRSHSWSSWCPGGDGRR